MLFGASTLVTYFLFPAVDNRAMVQCGPSYSSAEGYGELIKKLSILWFHSIQCTFQVFQRGCSLKEKYQYNFKIN